MNREITEKYGNRVRVRACGLCWSENKLLLVNHKHLTKGNFWAPPGGGLELGESVDQALVREFQEEASIQVKPGKFQFVCEFIQPPLHGIELFFEVAYLSGEPATGEDPESSSENQIITAVKFLDFEEIMAFPPAERHGIFGHVKTVTELKNLIGFYRL